MLGLAGLLSLASLILIHALLGRDFSLRYVAEHTSLDLAPLYAVTAFWAGQAGSLLLWALLLSWFGAVVVFQNRRTNRRLMPYVCATLSAVNLFFIGLVVFVANPLDRLAPIPEDGVGLNPLLQNHGMIFHPPALYLGYVGFTVPFAFALAALATGKLDPRWIVSTRRWTLFSWFFLGVGILLGAQWAYLELGWGGYWAWDPVENASLIPWLTATAYLHSVMIQEKKGMLKVWNLSLIILTFALCIFGTFLTRSGVVSSVHSFAGSSLGPLFVIFLVLVLGLSLGLLLYRLPRLSSEHRLDGLLSRESSFLFNNLILVGLAFTVLWGTMFPIISEWLAGTKMSVGPPFFNRVSLPIGLALLVLTGICPLIAWRRATLANFRRNLMLPLGAGALGATVLVAAGVHQPAAVGFFAGGIFVVWSIGAEFLRGARARQSISGEPFPLAFSRLVGRNKRRYGGFVVHVGMVVMLVGIVGSSVFQRELDVTLKPGESASLGSYSFVFRGLRETEQTDRAVVRADVDVNRRDRSLTTLQPERLASRSLCCARRLGAGRLRPLTALHQPNDDLDLVWRRSSVDRDSLRHVAGLP
jgi:cytochrome c-type biogenesis protein CcmF